jgi:hypothetical protein
MLLLLLPDLLQRVQAGQQLGWIQHAAAVVAAPAVLPQGQAEVHFECLH